MTRATGRFYLRGQSVAASPIAVDRFVEVSSRSKIVIFGTQRREMTRRGVALCGQNLPKVHFISSFLERRATADPMESDKLSAEEAYLASSQKWNEEINFEEIDEDLATFQEDELVQQALHRGVDLDKYGKELERDLRQVCTFVFPHSVTLVL